MSSKTKALDENRFYKNVPLYTNQLKPGINNNDFKVRCALQLSGRVGMSGARDFDTIDLINGLRSKH